MILSIIIIILLLNALFRGYHRGLVKELLFSVGTLLVFLIALFYDAQFGDFLLKLTKRGDPTDPFASFVAQSIAFWIIMLIGHILVRWLARLSQSVTWLPVIKQANGIGGALIAVVMMYLGLFLALALLNIITPDWFVNQYTSSPVAQFIVERTPVVSQQVIDWLFHTDTKSFTDSAQQLWSSFL
ncbi:MAG: CvpA family protein [Lactobacillaceae bacterium]|jgi:uncharacterized membrane protein required for colicin V production|nr:CvpA family protein [Lactobacillaceae bacterium]